MEEIILQEDIYVACLKADSFPDGIGAVHEKISQLAGPGNHRTCYGISYLYDDEILYMAAIETGSATEAEELTGHSFVLKKGKYTSITVHDYRENISGIEKAFKQLLADPGIDPNGCCVEWYSPKGTNGNTAKDVRCMVRLAD